MSVLDVSGVRVRLGNTDVLRDATFSASAGDIVALMGLSGSGKTTMLRAIAGLSPFDAGEIRVGDTHLRPGEHSKDTLRQLRAHVGMVFQFHHLFEHMSAIDNVALAPIHFKGVSRDDAVNAGRKLLEQMGVGSRAHAAPRELSGGEAQRVAIARALALEPPLLLLDEPTASLDPARRGELGDTLRRVAGSGRALLATSHDYDFVLSYATAVVVLAEGVVVEQGRPAEVLVRPTHPATKALLNFERSRTQ
jgi:polar amino acid transport system ATP-binding protein